MSEFSDEYLEGFLGTVRKYMQMRGGMSQKDLAEVLEVGVSTISRFINRKTLELNPQLIAKIVAKLEIPLHEIIDFVEEDYSDRFIRLVKFYKGDDVPSPSIQAGIKEKLERKKAPVDPLDKDNIINQRRSDDKVDDLDVNSDEKLGTAKKTVTANISVGKNKNKIVFGAEDGSLLSLKDKIVSLTPRQKAYLTDFLNLDMEGKDLMVDLGNPLFRYIRQKGMDL